MKMKKAMLNAIMVLALSASGLMAANVTISSDISTSTTWTANNVYNLSKQIYVLPGATLTIEPGTLVKNTAGVGGSLAVCRGAKIYVNGTESQPVIMTSSNDNLTTYRVGCNEWGNLTIMGDALISASHRIGNTANPTGLNQTNMEGLVAAGPGDTKVMYGGDNDNDDSGSISYLSLRYGGKVIGLGNELNGLSLGGVGRETDIHHVEVINNVDDGIEIWGGTVNLKYINIWNVGDDSLDIDQGWRGKAQFGLIVQGYSVGGSQGSGVGDNCIEMDGAEYADAQPVTTGALYNFTVIGQPIAGDHGTAWRDNARMQIRNSVFMNLGETLVKYDLQDDKEVTYNQNYGYNGTLSWANTWTTDSSVTSTVNPGPALPGHLYTAQTAGKLAEIKDSVFYANNYSTAYNEADSRGVRAAGNNNVTATSSPIVALTRGAAVTPYGSLTMLPVTYINPCANNDAVTSVATAPNDGFYTPVQFRGAFAPNNNWLAGWSAIAAYGMTDTSMNSTQPIEGDIDGDNDVDLEDFGRFSQNWLAGK